jgi:biopolymer transport protein ExbD
MAIGGRAGEVFTEINVTPLTDVFLVLLVIMILIAPLVNQTVLKVEAAGGVPTPQADNAPKLDAHVSAQGQITINNVPINPPDTNGVTTYIRKLQAQSKVVDIPLHLQSDDNAQQKYVVAVMDGAAGCGITHLQVLPLKH